MKGDFAEHLEMPVMDFDDNRPAREYVNSASIRLHSILFLCIAIAVVGAMLYTLHVATPASSASRNLISGYQTNGPSRAEASAAGLDLAARRNDSGARINQAENAVSAEGQAPNGGRPPGAIDLPEVALFLLAITSGAAGAAIHALTALATYAGNRQLVRSWLPWIYLRIPIGVLLSVLVYLGLRAGFFDRTYMTAEGGVFAVAFICAISGLFSKQVADELSDLVDNLLVPASKPTRADPLEGGAHGSAALTEVEQPQGVPEETIQAVQRNLIALGHLAAVNDRGLPADDGIFDETTRDAIESFLGDHGIVGEARAATLGEDTDPDYWSNLLDLLEQAMKVKTNLDGKGRSADS